MDTITLVSLTLLGVFALQLALGVHIAIAIGVASVVSASIIIEPAQMMFQATQKMFGGINNFGMLALPFFMLAGNIMNKGGIAKKLIDLALLLGGKLPGTLAVANVQANMLFGTLSGSAMASTAAIGGTIAPIQREKGYNPAFSAAINIASGPTGLFIPPSGLLVLFSLVSGGTSISALFMGGWIPGILWGLAVIAVAIYFAKRDNLPVEPRPETLKVALKVVVEALPPLLMVVLVIGGIVGGIFTATEGAAVSVIYSLVLCLCYNTLNKKTFVQIVKETALISGVIIFLISASSAMSWVLAFSQIPQTLSAILMSVSDNPIVIFLLVNLLLLVVGTFLDATPAVLIFTPILMPIFVYQFGMDPVQFGIMLIINVGIGSITPPVGTVLFVGCSVGEVSVEQVIKYLIPLFFVLLFVLMAVTLIPSISLFIPQQMGLI